MQSLKFKFNNNKKDITLDELTIIIEFPFLVANLFFLSESK